MTINNAPTDRENLEWLVYHALMGGGKDEVPCISISRGRELLGFAHMEEMREWLRDFQPSYKRLNNLEERCQSSKVLGSTKKPKK